MSPATLENEVAAQPRSPSTSLGAPSISFMTKARSSSLDEFHQEVRKSLEAHQRAKESSYDCFRDQAMHVRNAARSGKDHTGFLDRAFENAAVCDEEEHEHKVEE